MPNFLRQGLQHPRSGPPQERSDEEDGAIQSAIVAEVLKQFMPRVLAERSEALKNSVSSRRLRRKPDCCEDSNLGLRP